MTLAELQAARIAKMKAARDIYDAIGDADDPSAVAVKQVSDLNREIEDLEHQIKEALDARAQWQAGRTALADRAARDQTPVHLVPFPGNDTKSISAVPGNVAETLTLAERVLSDSQFKDFLQRIAPNGTSVSRGQFGNSPSVQMKTLITGASVTSGGALVVADRKPLVDLPFRPLTIRDIITVGTTNGDTVEYARVTTQTNNAGTVAEATGAGDATGSKPESALALEIAPATVKTIAHWIPATRRALSDAGQIRTLIDNFLRYGLEEELEDQIVAGDGAGENFTGLLNTSGTTPQAYTTDLLTTLRQARTKVRVTGRATPTAYVLHPNDWEDLDLLQDNEARYFFGGPAILGVPRLWGLPVVESEAMTEGTGMCADFRLAVLWDREQAQIMVSDSHSDFFTRNLVAILAEMRAAFGVLRPAAFVEIDLTA